MELWQASGTEDSSGFVVAINREISLTQYVGNIRQISKIYVSQLKPGNYLRH